MTIIVFLSLSKMAVRCSPKWRIRGTVWKEMVGSWHLSTRALPPHRLRPSVVSFSSAKGSARTFSQNRTTTEIHKLHNSPLLLPSHIKMDQQYLLTTELNHSKICGIPPVKSESALSEMSDSTLMTEASDSTFDSDRRVNFGAIHIREYERVVGDHPDTRIGVPLTIGWAFHEHEGVPLEKYETERVRKGNLRMSSITRKNILHNVFGIPEEELREAEKEVQKIKKCRERTMKQSKISAKSESALKGFKQRVKKVLNAEAFIKGLAAVASSGMMMTMTPH